MVRGTSELFRSYITIINYTTSFELTYKLYLLGGTNLVIVHASQGVFITPLRFLVYPKVCDQHVHMICSNSFLESN